VSREHFISLIGKIKKHPWLCDAWIIYIGERNTGIVSATHGEILSNIAPKSYSIRDEKAKDAGVWTDKAKKSRYGDHAREIFMMERIRYAKELIVLGTKTEEIVERQTDMRIELYKQVQRIQPTISGNQGDTALEFNSWSGKLDANGKKDPTINDDVAFSLFMGMYYALQFINQLITNIDYTLFR